ncbi:hypothetical protein BVY04_00400 [bacterium M21]|nr:hypothetical protein BVY04_00400 [bacterium M21]
MNFEEFLEYIKTHDEYTTQTVTKRPLFPSLKFYAGFVREVWIQASNTGQEDYLDSIQRGAHRMLRRCELVGATVHLSGLSNLKEVATDQPPVVVANHMSTLETVTLPFLVAPAAKVTYILKASLKSYPIFGKVITGMKAVGLTRKSPKEDLKAAINGGTESIKNGIGIIVFPQSTRSVQFDAKKFNSLGLRIAKKAETQVLPICLKTDMWGNGKLVKDFGKVDPSKDVHFHIGKPFQIGNVKQDQQAIVEFMTSHLAEWFGKQDAK